MKHLRTLAVLLPLLTPALAVPSVVQAGEMVTVTVVPGWRTAEGQHIAGLAIRLAPGWKTYWRSPGDAGIPPRFDWAGSNNLAGAAVRWPSPVTFEINGLISVGYTTDVIFPLVLTPDRPDAAIGLDMQVMLGVCETICVPVEAHVRIELPAQAAGAGKPDPRLTAALTAALAGMPQDATAAGVGKVTCRLEPTKAGLRLTAEVAMPPVGPVEFSVVETADPEIWVAEAVTRRTGNTLRIETQMEHFAGQPIALDRSGVRLTVLGGARAVDIQGCD